MTKREKLKLFSKPIQKFSNLLDSNELTCIRDYFKNNYANFEDPKEHHNCNLKSFTALDSDLDFLRAKLREKLNLYINKKLTQDLEIKKLYCSLYESNNRYNYHQDPSSTGISLLYQFNFEDDQQFSDLEFKDRENIAFENNQLLIFHSSLYHRYIHDNPNKKGIILSLLGE